MSFQQEMRAVENVHLHPIELSGVRHDFLQLVIGGVTAPEDQAGRLVLPVITRDRRKEGDEVFIVFEQLELNATPAP